MQENQELPKGWVLVKVDDITSYPSLTDRKIQQKAYAPSGKYPVVDQGKAFIAGYTDEELAIQEEPPVVVFGDHTRAFKYINFPFVAGADGVKVLKPKGVDARWYYYALLGIVLPDRGYGRHFQYLKNALLPIPPLPEQRRIVAKLEELFSRLDAGVATLRQTQAQLKRYRQSVLHAAVTGELTRAWRAAYPEPAESGEALLQRIRAERRAQWEAAQLAKRGGQLPLGDAWKKKYEEPAAPDTSELPELPQGWVWTNVNNLAQVIRGASPRPAGDPRYFGGDIPWITVGELTKDDVMFLYSVSNFVTPAGKENSRFIEPGTLLLTNSGATLGVPKITTIGGCINDGSVALLGVSETLKRYLYFVLKGMTQRLRQLNQGAAQPNLNTDIVRAIFVALPSEAEQEIIIEESERRLSTLDALEKALSAELTRAERLRQSILHRAFTGRIVPQDAADEPAAALLARLQDAPTAQPAAKGKRGRKAKGDSQIFLNL